MDEGVSLVSGGHLASFPVFSPQPAPYSPEVGTSESYLTSVSFEYIKGYLDCAAESIRYLTEVEGLPFDHPLVIGMQQNFSEHMQILKMQLLLQQIIQTELGSTEEEVEHRDPEELGNSQTEVDTETVQLRENKAGNQCDDEDLASDIAEEIYSLLYSNDKENDDSDLSDAELSQDEGFHEISELE